MGGREGGRREGREGREGDESKYLQRPFIALQKKTIDAISLRGTVYST